MPGIEPTTPTKCVPKSATDALKDPYIIRTTLTCDPVCPSACRGGRFGIDSGGGRRFVAGIHPYVGERGVQPADMVRVVVVINTVEIGLPRESVSPTNSVSVWSRFARG